VSKSEVSYRVRAASRRSRSQIPLGHAVRVLTTRIGNDYRGNPVNSTVPSPIALCGVRVNRLGGDYGAPVNCKRCIAKLRQMVATAPPAGHASQQAVAAQLALDAVYAAEESR
jgi:hypothetical protein